MSDSEENKSGASSALMNIASAYSDSDSSGETVEEEKQPKSLGSLVENLRAEAKRESEMMRATQSADCRNDMPSVQADENLCSTKIVRLDSGKVVKISTLQESHAAHEASSAKATNNVASDAASDEIQSGDTNGRENLLNSGSNVALPPEINSIAQTNPIETPPENDALKSKPSDDVEIEIVNVITKGEKHGGALDCKDQTRLNSSLSSPVKSTCPSGEMKLETKNPINEGGVEVLNFEDRVAPGDGSIEQEKYDKYIIQEKEKFKIRPDVEFVADISKNLLNAGNSINSKTWLPETSSLRFSKCNDKITVQTVKSPLGVIQDMSSVQESTSNISYGLSKPEEKTESTILSAYLRSKREKFMFPKNDDESVVMISEEDKNQKSNIIKDCDGFEKLSTAGSVDGSENDVQMENVGKSLLNPSENTSNNLLKDSLKSKSGRIEMNSNIETKTTVREVERLRLRVKAPDCGGEAAAKETEPGAASSAMRKMIESYEVKQPEVKKPTGSSPVKLKRNFGCIFTQSNKESDKKFCPEPSDTARLGPLETKMESKVGIPNISISSCMPDVPSQIRLENMYWQQQKQQQQQQEPVPPRLQSPVHALSPTFQQVSPQQSYQSTFTSMINSTQNQTPFRKSPQPAPQPQQRASRKEEQRRNLSIFLRKVEISNAVVEDGTTAKPFPKKEDESISTSPKDSNEVEIIKENISSESQEQSASTSFSNSSSNNGKTNFGDAVDFENMIGSSVVCKDNAMTPLSENAGSDNAQSAETKSEEQQQEPSTCSSTPPAATETPNIVVPKKRGRPRKFPLPETGTLVAAWPKPVKEGKSVNKSSKRKKYSKKLKGDGEATDDDDAPRKRFIPRYKKKRKSGGDEPEVTRCFNKKGRMEVLTEGCKPVTVNQITEYFWPPTSSLTPGEKPEGLMIQEQISEYLGVKSFKRKYPSIKRRPVDMEERNYLQENGYVSENMCDMGLTAVFSSDIIEIMYNDFPHKFEEYRRHAREKKLKEQKALREKQAAENMDPRKEALESAVSWNTDFNKTRRNSLKIRPRSFEDNTTLLLPSYIICTWELREWYERKCDEEFNLAMYLKRKERGILLTSKLRRLFANFLRDVQLTLPTRGLQYGSIIQLMAPDVDGHPPWDTLSSNKGLAFAVTLDPDETERKQNIEENLLIVGSPILSPCARNTFHVEAEDKTKEGQPLCHGDVFYLRCAAETEVPLYVSVPVLSPYGAVGKSGFPNPRLGLCKSFDARFRILHLNEGLRIHPGGFPVAPFEKVLIVHAAANVPLCVESSCWQNSLFSPECEVSVRSARKVNKEYEDVNRWMLVVDSSK